MMKELVSTVSTEPYWIKIGTYGICGTYFMILYLTISRMTFAVIGKFGLFFRCVLIYFNTEVKIND